MSRNNDILNELKELNSPLAELPHSMPFTVPGGYFEQLPNEINTAKKRGINKTMPHSVPTGYFESLSQEVLAATQQPETPKKRILQFAPIRWMAAAILIITITIGGYNFLQPSTPSIKEQLSSVPESDLLAYVQYNIDEFGPELVEQNITDFSLTTDKIDDNKLQEYLENEVW